MRMAYAASIILILLRGNKMDYGKIFTRAWQLVWRNKVLWVLGILASCAGGGGGSGSFNLPNGGNGGSTSNNTDKMMQDVERWLQNNIETVIGIAIAVVCILFVIGFIFWLIGILGRGALVAGVDQLEAIGHTTFREAWQGSTQYWRPLLGMHILLELPVLIGVLIMLGGGGALAYQIFQSTSATRGSISPEMTSTLIGAACVGIPLICGMVIYGVFAAILRVFGERAIMLEDRAMMDGLRTGWAVFRRNMSNAIVLGVLMWLIGIAVGIVFGILAVIVALPADIGAAVTANQSGLNAATIGLVTCAAGLIGVVAALVNGIVTAFSSTLWTLAYRQFSK